MQTGTVRVWNPGRGFGYIEPDEPDEGEDLEVCVYRSAVELSGHAVLQPGQRVQFAVARGPDGGMRAVDLQVMACLRAQNGTGTRVSAT